MNRIKTLAKNIFRANIDHEKIIKSIKKYIQELHYVSKHTIE
jgi:hypothetical protein